MTAAKSTEKPAKPYDGYPLFAHRDGSWCKKYQGKHVSFGRWDDPQAALAAYLKWRESIEAGLEPVNAGSQFTIGDLVEAFMDAKAAKRKAGDLTQRSVDAYHVVGKWLAAQLGEHRPVETLRPEDFARLRSEFPSDWGTYAVTARITAIRSMCKWAYDCGYIDRPIRFGDGFSKPSRRRQRIERASKPSKDFSAAEIRKLIAAADPQLKAMILLGVNCGYGNIDCARLRIDQCQGAWLRVPRGKTGEDRSAWLWPETRAAIADVIKYHEQSNVKPKPGCEGLLFRTHHGREWVSELDNRNSVAIQFRKLKIAAKVHRAGVGFYALRHVTETIGGDCGDQVATNHLLGHIDDSMSARYRERVADHRIRKVCQHIRTWLGLDGAK